MAAAKRGRPYLALVASVSSRVAGATVPRPRRNPFTPPGSVLGGQGRAARSPRRTSPPRARRETPEGGRLPPRSSSLGALGGDLLQNGAGSLGGLVRRRGLRVPSDLLAAAAGSRAPPYWLLSCEGSGGGGGGASGARERRGRRHDSEAEQAERGRGPARAGAGRGAAEASGARAPAAADLGSRSGCRAPRSAGGARPGWNQGRGRSQVGAGRSERGEGGCPASSRRNGFGDRSSHPQGRG